MEDVTVQDVVEKANPKKFNLVAQSLAGDCVALAPTAGADDLPGVEAAANAVYRSVAGGSNNPAGVRRVEQGLRRLAAALDKTSPVSEEEEEEEENHRHCIQTNKHN